MDELLAQLAAFNDGSLGLDLAVDPDVPPEVAQDILQEAWEDAVRERGCD